MVAARGDFDIGRGVKIFSQNSVFLLAKEWLKWAWKRFAYEIWEKR
jgi:hypothetical protein